MIQENFMLIRDKKKEKLRKKEKKQYIKKGREAKKDKR